MDKAIATPYYVAYFGVKSLRSLVFLLTDDDVTRTFVDLDHDMQIALFDLIDSGLKEIGDALEQVKECDEGYCCETEEHGSLGDEGGAVPCFP
ncbi:hypothetical protein WS67_19300 [Burkholderia singularis]|uniref:Uncharacterized protein n=1 Tax=Burkholderia singularis TaxID=1503053 RepID=A0A103DYN8_9BURK|nr:hypothetical protein [Burkholderia singularis]KVE25130.1 hypothetical protein WS67_19300 [Burkholderia singularis]